MQEDTKQRIMASRRAVCTVYLPGSNGRFYWPNRLQPQNEATPAIRRKSHNYIIDSGWSKSGEDISNQDIKDAAVKYQPDYVIPNDVVRYNADTNRDAIEGTAEAVAEFLDMVEEDRFPSTILVPLQPPYDLHLAYLNEYYPRQAKRSHFALGGLAKDSPSEQLYHIRRFRRIAGYGAYAHGFGLGVSRHMIEALRDDPALLDSIDAATAQYNANNGCTADIARKQVYIGIPQGEDATTGTGQYMMAEMTTVARMLAPSMTSEENIEINFEKLPSVEAPEIDLETGADGNLPDEITDDGQQQFADFAEGDDD